MVRTSRQDVKAAQSAIRGHPRLCAFFVNVRGCNLLAFAVSRIPVSDVLAVLFSQRFLRVMAMVAQHPFTISATPIAASRGHSSERCRYPSVFVSSTACAGSRSQKL